MFNLGQDVCAKNYCSPSYNYTKRKKERYSFLLSGVIVIFSRERAIQNRSNWFPKKNYPSWLKFNLYRRHKKAWTDFFFTCSENYRGQIDFFVHNERLLENCSQCSIGCTWAVPCYRLQHCSSARLPHTALQQCRITPHSIALLPSSTLSCFSNALSWFDAP